MTNTTKSLLAFAVIASAFGAIAFFGGSPFGAQPVPQQQQQTNTLGATTQGSTFSNAKQGSVVVSLANPGANATSSSVLNPSTSDWYITAVKAACEGVGSSNTAYSGAGLAALTLKIATTSTAAPAANGNTNLVGTAALTIATTTAQFVISSSTAGIGLGNTTSISNIWAAGSYETFTFNATNTAACTVGLDYFSS